MNTALQNANFYSIYLCFHLGKNFIGKKVLLKFTVKPRSDTGVIFYIAKNNFDYLTVELHKGEVWHFCV